jgi:hypothetical protein
MRNKNIVKKVFFISIASFCIRVNFYLFEKEKSNNDLLFNIQKVYGPYIINNSKKTHFLINVFSGNKYFFLKKKSDYYLFIFNRKKNKINTTNYISISQFNYIIIQVLIELLAKTGFFFHGSVVLNERNEALVFTGKSGSGKSTISELLSKKFTKIADDSFFIISENNNYFVYTNPQDFNNQNIFNSKLLSKINKKFPLKFIFFLKKAKYNKIEKNIFFSFDLVKKIFQQIAINKNYRKLHFSSLINFIKKNQKKIYSLYFVNNDTIIDFMEKIQEKN